jgi:hypothetical protein
MDGGKLTDILNNKASRKGNTMGNCQPLGKGTRAEYQLILWQATIDKPKFSTVPPGPDES